MPQWRASPSRPAPPVASTHPDNPSNSFDSLFASTSSSRSSRAPGTPSTSASSSSSTPARGLSSSSSAYSLLSRKMAEMEDEDDRMSIRSGVSARSGTAGSAARGLEGGASGDSDEVGAGKGRGRATSSASSVRTARGRVDANDDLMDVDEPRFVDGEGKGKGKEPDTLPSSSTVKRQRRRAPSLLGPGADRSPRRRSTYQAPGGSSSTLAAGPQPTLSTTTADDLMPSMRKKPDRASSVSSASTSTKSLSRPLQPSTSTSTLRPPRPSPDRKATSPAVDPPSSTSPQADQPLSTRPSSSTAPSQRSAKSSLARRSWFGMAAAPEQAPSASEAPTPATPQSSTADEPMCTSEDGERAGLVEQAPASGPTPLESASEPARQDGTESPAAAAAAPPHSWLSLVARATPSSLNLAAQALGYGAPASIEAMQLDEPAPVEDNDSTPPATPRAARPDDDTVRVAPVPPPSHDSATAASTAADQSASRASWFGWGWSGPATEPDPSAPAESTAAAPDESTPAAPPVVPSSAATAVVAAPTPTSTPAPDAAPSSSSTTSSAAGSGWLRAFTTALTAGPQPSAEALIEQRRREAWALKLAAQNAARDQKAIESAPVVTEGERAEPMSGEPVQSQQHEQQEALTPAQQIKHRASSSAWNLSSSLFSRTPNSLRGPLASLGVGSSSAASTHSHGSSHATDTAPSSPQLRPQSNQGPVKPLTGSIRSSPRQGRPSPGAVEPPSPAVIDNLVLPTFNDTFFRPPRSFAPKKSTITRAVSAVSAYLFHRPPEELTSPRLAQAQLAAGVNPAGLPTEMEDDPAEQLPKALEAVGEPARLDKVKRVVTIGVHGWFTSNNMIKSVMGEQTGTSVKFATMMHDAVQAYLESHDLGSFNIQAIALEGQGMVEERVSKLYDQLVGREEWVRALKMADAVFLATHSQGCVVSTQLLARMLDQGLITGTQTHLLAMCGIAQGPFVYLYQSIALAPYFNYLESAPARELFDYQSPESVATIKFLESLRIILNAGVKVTSVGSINDQVVPLYSALFSGIDHPGILRAVFIDSDAFRTSDFLANLVVFSARLRNAGLSDHDLVYHVSEALAGALTGVGHSRIYEEADVYRLAVQYHFETTSLVEPPTSLDVSLAGPPLSIAWNPRDRRNPYLLTWAMRGIVEDRRVRELFGKELSALREAYETWRPQTKVLKDVKLKLEGIRLMTPQRSGKL
ncbi:hypothetical protein JCM3775_001337 [Rhodotorula graminis]|uniref:YMC020W-like alpha/beta hydrolase domain-containing protein n=1 Tax=Rhodotorula graminis (strain WP1) TaxID=578459 RepID=A0A194S692_RHOGW|nr:uncharacterized protein RHOBADRAFT_52282 [Rhodotorula graminis WP1]KPV76248.1 hypothetical protein RHOBADRAFT_52282 [Rhodotorula graminis WP1]